MYNAIYNKLHFDDLQALQNVMVVQVENEFNDIKGKPDSLSISNMIENLIEMLYDRKFNT